MLFIPVVADEAALFFFVWSVKNRWADAIEPTAQVAFARDFLFFRQVCSESHHFIAPRVRVCAVTRERRARELLRVEAVVALLRGVLALGQGTLTAGILAPRLVAETALVLYRYA